MDEGEEAMLELIAGADELPELGAPVGAGAPSAVLVIKIPPGALPLPIGA